MFSRPATQGKHGAPASRALVCVLAMAWAVLLASAATELFLRLDPLSPWLLRTLDRPSQLPDALGLHRQVLDLLLHGRELTAAAFTTKETSHFKDVAEVITGLRRLGALSGLVVLLAFFWNRRGSRPGLSNLTNRANRALLAGLANGARGLLGLLLGLALCAPQWPLFFTAFHPLLFPGGGYSFNPHVHVIVRLYPKAYFAAMGAGLAVSIALVAGAAAGSALFLGRRSQASSHVPPPTMRAVPLWSFPAALLVTGLCHWAGRHTQTAASPGFWAYYAICCALLAGSMGLLLASGFGRRRALALLLAGLLAYAGLDSGLRVAHAQAMETIHGPGERIIADLEAYRAKAGHVPLHLAELGGVPPVLVPGSAWKYSPQAAERYFLGFLGPLHYHYQYDSRRGRWKRLRLTGEDLLSPQ